MTFEPGDEVFTPENEKGVIVARVVETHDTSSVLGYQVTAAPWQDVRVYTPDMLRVYVEPVSVAPKKLFRWTDDTDMREAICQALGAASMCWTPKPTGVFDPDLVLLIANELTDWIEGQVLEAVRVFAED